jgi:hypothetical protein
VSSFPSHENFTVPISLVVPTIVMEVNCLELFFKSLELSTLFSRESILVASGTLENLSQIKKLKELIQNALIPNLKLILKHDGLLLQSTSRNIGASMSSQPFISFCDGDDYMHPQRFEILNKITVEHPEIHVILHMWEKFTTKLPVIHKKIVSI